MFKENEEITEIIFPDGATVRAGIDCDKITVSLEAGQMSYVPWFEVWKDGKVVKKWNAAMVEGIIL